MGKSICSTNSSPSSHHLAEEQTGFEAVGLYFENISRKGFHLHTTIYSRLNHSKLLFCGAKSGKY